MGLGGNNGEQLIQYINVPKIIALLVGNKMASLHELSTVYGLEDAYDLIEILVVDSNNKALLNKPSEED